MHLDQFTSEEIAVIKIAVTEFIVNTKKQNWELAMKLTKEDREKIEQLISLSKDVLEKIELNNIL